MHPFRGSLKNNKLLRKAATFRTYTSLPSLKHLMDNKHQSSNCQFKTLLIMWLWVTSCPQEQLGNLDRVAFTVLKFCSNRLVFSAGVIQKNTKPHSSKLPPALCEG